GGFHRHHDFPGSRRRIGQVLEFKIVGAAEARAENGFHGCPDRARGTRITLGRRTGAVTSVRILRTDRPTAFTLSISPVISMTSGRSSISGEGCSGSPRKMR